MLTKSRFIEQLMIREKLSKKDAEKIYKSTKIHKKCITKCKKNNKNKTWKLCNRKCDKQHRKKTKKIYFKK